MTAMPIRPAKAPSVIANQPNGAVDERLLDVVDRPQRTWMMAALPALGLRAIHAGIKRDLGVTLSSTGRGRTLAEQWQIFGGSQARYRPCSPTEFDDNHGQNKELTKEFPAEDRFTVSQLLPGVVIADSDHWTKIQFPNGLFPATAAVPGTSAHGMWCADDLAMPDGADKGNAPDALPDAVVDWLFTHELDFGFAHGTKSEKWHIQWCVGDQVPPALLAFEEEERLAGRVPVRRDEFVETTPEEDDMAKAIKAGNSDAVFLVTGIVASWVNDPADYAIAEAAGLAPPFNQVQTVNRSTFGALRLVGAVPPGFIAGDFREVVEGAPPPVPPPPQ